MMKHLGHESLIGGKLRIGRCGKVAMATFAIVGATWAWASVPVHAQAKGSQSLESAFRELDARAKDFHSVSADIERTKVTVVVNDKSTESGTIKVRGDRMLLDLTAPDPRTILRTGDSLFVYTPGLKRVEEYNLGKNRALLDQFLLLGFGTDSNEMRKSYLVTYMKEDKIDDRKAVELELTPKMEAVRSQISKIQIWLDESTWLPAQQEFFEAGSGDYSIVKYSKIVRNPDLPDSQFKPHWPKGTERIHPQG
jgi:outer membrane lipoprotein-sorting protein